MQARLFVIHFVLSALICACSDPGGETPGHDPGTPLKEQVAIDGEEQAVDSGRAEILLIERHLSRRTREGTMRLQRTVTLPQFVGGGAGLDRINGFLRHLALHRPRLPQEGRSSPSESAEMMGAIGDLAEKLRPEDWPTLAQMESLGGLFPDEYLKDEFFPEQNETAFSIRIVQLDSERAVLHLDIFDASGATTRGYGGELTLDLRTGRAIGPH